MSLIPLTDWEELKRIEEFLDEGTPSIDPRVIDSLHELQATCEKELASPAAVGADSFSDAEGHTWAVGDPASWNQQYTLVTRDDGLESCRATGLINAWRAGRTGT